MKWIITPILLFWVLFTHAQVLEEVNFSPHTATPFDTYTSGINDSGFICGYYINSFTGNKIGYVVNSLGKQIIFDGNSMSPVYTHVTVEGINDSNTILLNCTNSSGNIDIRKGYYNHQTQTYYIVSVTGNGQPNVAKPFGISNKNVYAGWYPNGTDRWLFTLNDSSVSTLPTWNASRYSTGSFPSITYHPTYVLGNNDNDLLCGYYIDGINYPLVYNAQSNTYSALPFSNNMKLHDINNNNKVVGEYKLPSGFYCGFYGDYATGTITNFTSINPLFTAPNVQSVVNGINDKGEMVGSYYHPGSLTWVGFIYRPNQNEYRLPDFSYATDTWSIPNNNVNMSTDIWTPNYYGNFNYSTVDPFTWNGFPLMNSVVQAQHPSITSVANSQPVSWKGFAQEDIAATLSSIPNISFYENNLKPLLFTKYWNQYKQAFNGYCFGFSYSTLLRKYREPDFVAWYNMPSGTNISTVPNTDTLAIAAIERTYLKQYNPSWANIMFPITTSYWSGMFRMKNNMNLDAAHTNPQSVGIGLGTAFAPAGGHNLLPYKIRTPKTLPFDVPNQLYDTLFVYDSSNPNDSTQMFVVYSPLTGTQAQNASNASWPNMYELRFQKVALKDLVYNEYSALKHTRAQNDSMFQFSIRENLFFDLKNNLSNQMKIDASGFSNSCANIIPFLSEEVNTQIPGYYTSDTNSTFQMSCSNYTDSVMSLNITKPYLCFGISRKALPIEYDHTSLGHRFLSYGNPNAIQKNLNAYFVKVKPDGTEAATILANNIDMNQGDSLLTENPSAYIYKITKINGVTSTYDLTTYTFFNDTAKQFHSSNIPLAGNSSHSIDGFFNGGNSTVVFVDNGLNGSNDDTLFISEVPLSVLEGELENKIKMHIYPIPAQQQLFVEIEDLNENCEILIAGIDGRIVYRMNYSNLEMQSTISIPVQNFTNGTYVIFVKNAHGELKGRTKFNKE